MSTQIDKNKQYEGYIWLSDQREPIIFDGKDNLLEYSEYFDAEVRNPFIVEGQLYCASDKISYSIRHLGDKVHIFSFDLNTIEDTDHPDEVSYFAHRMGDRKLKFKRIWTPQKDENCCDMEVLTLDKLVFIGFENSKK